MPGKESAVDSGNEDSDEAVLRPNLINQIPTATLVLLDFHTEILKQPVSHDVVL